MSFSAEKKSELVNSDKNHVWHHLTQHKGLEENDPIIMVEGQGMRVTDIEGKEYLDATSGGVWTVNVGYGSERIANAIYKQLQKLPYFAATAGTVPSIECAQAIVETLPGLDRVYYSNSGSEANEKAYKIVRQLAHKSNNGKKHKVLFRNRDYHGTTITTLSSSGQEERKEQYGPFTDGFVEVPHCSCYRCPFNKTYGDCNIECATAVEDIILKEDPDTVGSIVLEPITAGGGVIIPPPEYFPKIQEICKKYDVLVHIDEVVCGMGRTGKWFGYQHFDIQPDIVTTAKGLASGYAGISITVTTEALFNEFKTGPDDRMDYFRDISTFGGCLSGPIAALENINIIKEDKLLENVAEMGTYLLDKLHGLAEKHICIGDVRGVGLLAGIELVTDRETKEPMDESVLARISGDCTAQGVLIGRTNRSLKKFNNTLLFSPAFICTRADIDEIIEAVDNALTSHT